ncbi:MAG: hypothetical protein KF812_02910 [Fimbriimonadaceae bacterium]|nr:hypothetical protein [Fimbriimonadaceae bacterium]
MKNSHIRFAICVATLAILCTITSAKPEFWRQYQQVQTMQPRTHMLEAQCLNCHIQPPRRNPFGNAISQAMRELRVGSVTKEVLAKVAAKDSDGDGFTNEQEWKADTLPGNPNSKPTSQTNSSPSGWLSHFYLDLTSALHG